MWTPFGRHYESIQPNFFSILSYVQKNEGNNGIHERKLIDNISQIFLDDSIPMQSLKKRISEIISFLKKSGDLEIRDNGLITLNNKIEWL